MPEGKVIVFHGPGIPLECRLEHSPAPGPGEILVRMAMAGICGTDAHRLRGDLPPPANPVCLGHEGVGTVEALGAGETTDRAGAPLRIGDRVYWAPPAPCGECWTCTAGENPARCERLVWPLPAAGPNAAAFREFATVGRKSALFRISEGTSSEAVIAFGCAMPTAIAGFDRLGPVPEHVVVQGAGPVGLASVVLASLAGASTISVIGDPPNRLAMARALGATETLSLSGTTRAERREHILHLTRGRGAGAVIEAAGVREAFPEGFDLLGMNGRFLILGLFSGDAVTPIDPVRINNFNLRIIGSLGMPPGDYRRTIDLAAAHGKRLRFGELVTHRFPLSRTEEAIATAAHGLAGKAVVVPESSAGC